MAALVVEAEEEWVIEVAMMTNIKDLDPEMGSVAVGLEMVVVVVVVLAAEALDQAVVDVADLEGMMPVLPFHCYHFHFRICTS